MNEPLIGVAALLRRRIECLAQEREWLPSFNGAEIDAMRKEHLAEMEAMQKELRVELESRRVVLLGVAHALQDVGHPQNDEFRRRLSFLSDSYGATILLEEWASDRPASFACRLAAGKLKYRDVGTPEEPQFVTFANAPITYPGHDGTLGPCPDAPSLMEYGPLGAQENREQSMLQNINDAMQSHRVGLFVVGLAHLHSMAMKLQAAQYRVAAYTWLGSGSLTAPAWL